MTTAARPTPNLGEYFDAPPVASERPAHRIVVVDKTSPGTFTGNQLRDTVWSSRYSTLFFLNRSPWVERSYCDPVSDVVLLSSTPVEGIPVTSQIAEGDWVCELLDQCDAPGALGYHEGHGLVTKAGPSGAHSVRSIGHPQAGDEAVVMKIGVVTSREDNAYVTEVVTHEIDEAVVDPYVDNEAEIRSYKNPADGKEYIGEVGDPVQERPFDVGGPEGRPCGVPEAMVSDFAYPAWWGQQQRRTAVCFTQDAESWKTLPQYPQIKAFEVAAGGYMSIRSPGGEWEQIYGEKAKHRPDPDDQGGTA